MVIVQKEAVAETLMDYLAAMRDGDENTFHAH